ncbi:MAG: Holliday junction resolvase RuvX [Chloroflexi bacterium]|nr:Holliday junction resolvase RuvX [Chloroflexota bacterium]
MRFLCLDLGRKRIGVAMSDETRLIATPIGTIQVRNQEQVFQEIVRLVETHQAVRLILGLPLRLNGQEGIESNRARTFAADLENYLSIPIDFMDERLTSVEAERIMLEAGVKRNKRRAKIDATAAALILQAYLDAERHSLKG